MANKTIYVRDEALWERAKALAGKDGLSALVAEALEKFVAQKEQEQQGLRRFDFRIGISSDEATGAKKRIAFDGREIINVEEPGYRGHGKATVGIYQTKAGRLVVIDTPIYPQRHATYDTVEQLASDETILRLLPHKRAELIEKITRAIGKEVESEWID